MSTTKRSDGQSQAPDDAALDLLLSRGRLVGPAAERLRERVLDGAAVRRPPFWRRLPVLVPALAMGATAAVLLVARPRTDDPGLRPKGVAGEVALALACSGGSASACPRGARLSIAFPDGFHGGSLGAFAEPEGGGERIWYFSVEDGLALAPAAPGAALGSRAVVLGSEHRPGRYLVHVVVSDRPLPRAELLAPGTPGVRARQVLPLTVVEP